MWFPVLRKLLPCTVLFSTVSVFPVIYAAPTDTDAVMNDITTMLDGNHANTRVEKRDKGIFVEMVYCGKEQNSLPERLKGKTGLKQEAELIGLFQKILCTKADYDSHSDTIPSGSLMIKQFGSLAADPFRLGSVFSTRGQELGDWSLELDDDGSDHMYPRDESWINMLGLSTSGPLSQVTLWQTLSPEHARIWFAAFRHSPSQAMTYEFELRNNHWVWTAGIESMRL